MNAIQRFYSVLKRKDESNQKYYYTIIVIDDNNIELEQINHIGNKNATGADQFREIAESAVEAGFSKLIVKQYINYGNNSKDDKEISKTIIPLNEIAGKNKEVANLDSTFSMFGGFKGFLAERDMASSQAIEVKQRDLEIRFLEKELEQLRNEHSSMLAKLGEAESKSKKYEQENFDLQRKSGIFNIITEGLGNVLMKNIGSDTLNGLLGGTEVQMNDNPVVVEQTDTQNDQVVVEENEPQIENKVAKLIYNWLLTCSEENLLKIYDVMKYMSKKNSDNINELYELIKS